MSTEPKQTEAGPPFAPPAGYATAELVEFCERKAGTARYSAGLEALADLWRPRLIAEAEIFEAIAARLRGESHNEVAHPRVSGKETKE